MKKLTLRVHAFAGAIAAALCPVAGNAETSSSAERQFSFLHLSDIHVETFPEVPADLSAERSFKAVSTIPGLEKVQFPGGTTAPKPSFLIATGDVTEFGFAGATGDVVDTYFKDVTIPKYFATGNHDNTWAPPTKWLREKYGSQNYTFEHGGCRFIALNSASLQDPNPSFGQETIRFLRNTLRTVDNRTPIFVYFHHPLFGSEFASKYDCDRVVDALRAHNAVLFLVGHGHGTTSFDFAGIPGTMGGSTFSKTSGGTDGYAMVHVDGDKLRVAYKRIDETSASKSLLERDIPKQADYPSILTGVETVLEDGVAKINFNATISGTRAPIASALYEIDDVLSGPLKLEGATASGTLETTAVLPGAHFVRFKFRDAQDRWFQRSAAFYNDVKDPKLPSAAWRYEMGGGTRSTPLVLDGRVYVGANDGVFHAVDAKTGRKAWTFDAKAEVATSPASFGDLILFGAADGKFYGLTRDGEQKWLYDAKLPIFGSPVVDDGGTVYFGSNSGVLTALDAATGKEKWKSTEPGLSIEARPLLHDGKLYVGAWDGLVYCFDTKDGKVLWKKPSTHNQKRVVRYYAAADSTPVIAGGKLFVADRGYYGGRYSLDGLFEEKVAEDVTAFSLSEDSQSLYARSTKSGLYKTDSAGTTLWQSEVIAGRIPAAAIEQKGRVFLITNQGTLHVMDAATGAVQHKYQVTPGLFVMTAPAVHDNVVYTAGLDGVLTAVRIPASAE